jgi:hypothetical protein
MVKRISASRPASLEAYGVDEFEKLINQAFEIADIEAVSPSRTMYHLIRVGG